MKSRTTLAEPPSVTQNFTRFTGSQLHFSESKDIMSCLCAVVMFDSSEILQNLSPDQRVHESAGENIITITITQTTQSAHAMAFNIFILGPEASWACNKHINTHKRETVSPEDCIILKVWIHTFTEGRRGQALNSNISIHKAFYLYIGVNILS